MLKKLLLSFTGNIDFVKLIYGKIKVNPVLKWSKYFFYSIIV